MHFLKTANEHCRGCDIRKDANCNFSKPLPCWKRTTFQVNFLETWWRFLKQHLHSYSCWRLDSFLLLKKRITCTESVVHCTSSWKMREIFFVQWTTAKGFWECSAGFSFCGTCASSIEAWTALVSRHQRLEGSSTNLKPDFPFFISPSVAEKHSRTGKIYPGNYFGILISKYKCWGSKVHKYAYMHLYLATSQTRDHIEVKKYYCCISVLETFLWFRRCGSSLKTFFPCSIILSMMLLPRNICDWRISLELLINPMELRNVYICCIHKACFWEGCFVNCN